MDHPDDETMRVSYETIYTSLYLQGRGGLKREPITALRSGRLRRRPRRHGEQAKRANVLGDITPVSQRPPEAADRSVPGHWEGDLVRHEALLNRVVMKGHHTWSVAAGFETGGSLAGRNGLVGWQAAPTTPGRTSTVR